jgi:hypothetical protein
MAGSEMAARPSGCIPSMVEFEWSPCGRRFSVSRV